MRIQMNDAGANAPAAPEERAGSNKSATEQTRNARENRAFRPEALRRRWLLQGEKDGPKPPSTLGMSLGWTMALALLTAGAVLVGRFADLWRLVKTATVGE
ncbi:MAG: hypothetical protein IPK82_09860 [Polyangiaceae bacterium]|nr:hypothetical protein [Polyangiaceae bacterium]